MSSLIVRLTLMAMYWHALFGCCVHHGHSAHLAACRGGGDCSNSHEHAPKDGHAHELGCAHATRPNDSHDKGSSADADFVFIASHACAAQCPDPDHDSCRETSCLFVAPAKSNGNAASLGRFAGEFEPDRWLEAADLAPVVGFSGPLGQASCRAFCRNARAASVPLFVLHQVRLI